MRGGKAESVPTGESSVGNEGHDRETTAMFFVPLEQNRAEAARHAGPVLRDRGLWARWSLVSVVSSRWGGRRESYEEPRPNPGEQGRQTHTITSTFPWIPAWLARFVRG